MLLEHCGTFEKVCFRRRSVQNLKKGHSEKMVCFFLLSFSCFFFFQLLRTVLYPILRRFFVFNDCLVYGKKISATSCQYKGRINLGSAWIRILQDTKKIKNVFQVVDVEKTYTMYADTKEEKEVWVTKLQKTIDELMNKFPELKETRKDAKPARPQTLFQPFTVNVDIFVVAGDDEYGRFFALLFCRDTFFSFFSTNKKEANS